MLHRRKIIIVEGMDNCGKDTQIKNIAEMFPDSYFHTLHYHAIKSRSNEDARKMSEDTYWEMFRILEQMYDFDFILNRSHYGEYVYGKIYRGYQDPEYVLNLEQNLRWQSVLRDAVLITFVNSDVQSLISREDGESLSNGDPTLFAIEYHRFRDVHEQSIINEKRKKLIDIKGLSIHDVRKAIEIFLWSVYG